MAWKTLLDSMLLLSLPYTGWLALCFGIEQSMTKTGIPFIESPLAHSLYVFLVRMARSFLDFFQFLYPSFLVLFSFCWAAVLSFSPRLQSAGIVIDWTQIFLGIAILITFIVAVDGWRKANAEARKNGAEAAETIAKLVLRVMALENKIGLLESENRTLRTRIVELESKLPNEGK